MKMGKQMVVGFLVYESPREDRIGGIKGGMNKRELKTIVIVGGSLI